MIELLIDRQVEEFMRRFNCVRSVNTAESDLAKQSIADAVSDNTLLILVSGTTASGKSILLEKALIKAAELNLNVYVCDDENLTQDTCVRANEVIDSAPDLVVIDECRGPRAAALIFDLVGRGIMVACTVFAGDADLALRKLFLWRLDAFEEIDESAPPDHISIARQVESLRSWQKDVFDPLVDSDRLLHIHVER